MRPRLVWALFALCLAVVLAAMAWSSATVLRLDSAERQARSQAALEENARLALWRMDSFLTGLLAQESARPYFQYGAFYPAAAAYGRMFSEPGGDGVLAASPLLRETPDRVLLHFQLSPRGDLTSPQVPAAALGERALRERLASPARLAEGRSRLSELRTFVSEADLAGRLPSGPPQEPATRGALSRDRRSEPPGPSAASMQKLKSAKEYVMRQQAIQQANVIPDLLDAAPAAAAVAAPEVHEGSMTPLWAGDALILARRVRVVGADYVQGCWLAWPRLEAELLASIEDLLPDARLERSAGGDDERRLASLPVRLVPGALAEARASSATPVRLSLAGAWAGVLLAALAVAALLRGVLDLSERRRVFVSAVTHELRTPLTTFRLYTDMLAEGMVPDEEKRRGYVGRLRAEAERLSHLVENVVFYSRLESGRAGAVRETMDLADAVAQVAARLVPGASAAGLELVVEGAGGGGVRAKLDRSALEQVLANLVDNACKYAAGSRPPLVHLEVGSEQGRARIRVRDHGPGLSHADRRRLFRDFSKSDREAADSRPGVGLGLALSRRLMRAQGGDLALDDAVKDGAAFVVTLPVSPD